MKALIVGDPHLQIQRLEDNEKFLKKLVDLSNGHDFVIFLGDLFHTFSVIRSEILNQWNWFFDEMKRKRMVISLVGNHDYAGQTGGSHALEVFKDRSFIVDKFCDFNGIYFAPFIRDHKEFEKIVSTIPIGGSLICHQSFTGAEFASGYADSEGVDISHVAHLSYVISGHIHTEQRVANVWYPGTPYQMNFGEAGDRKRVFSVDLYPAEYQIRQEHDLGMPEFVDVKADLISDIVLPNPNPNHSYRFIAKGSPAEIAGFWAKSEVKEFKNKVRRIVDGMTSNLNTERTSKVINHGTKQEKLNTFISGRKWRTSPDRVKTAAATLLHL